MTYKEIREMVATIGLPYAYHHFPANKSSGLKPPYVTFYCDGIDDLYGDNKNYQRIQEVKVELYEAEKDFELEQAVEEVLEYYGFSYDKIDVYIASEDMLRVTYEGEIVITKED